MIIIKKPIHFNKDNAYVSISKWSFDKEVGDSVRVAVVIGEDINGEYIYGKGTIGKKNWIKTAKQTEKKIVFRPNEPMIYYYNYLVFDKPKTADEIKMEFCKQNY